MSNSAEPNPGSREALDRGCTCPVADNEHGRGIPWPREDGLDPVAHPSFWVSVNCPLHARGDATAEYCSRAYKRGPDDL